MHTKKTTTKQAVLDSIIEGLSEKPELAARIERIMKLADEPASGGRIRSADEVEAILVEEVRKLGNETLAGWAEGVDLRLGKELKEENPKVRMREKKT